MERELIGGGIQIISFLMGITGVTLQRRAMIADDHEDDFVLVHSLTSAEEEDYGTFAEDLDIARARRLETLEEEMLRSRSPQAYFKRKAQHCYVLRSRLRNISKMWLLGFCIFYASQVVEIFSLSFASQSTVVAVGSLGSFVNAFIAVKVFHETFQFLPPRHEPNWFKKMFRWDLLNLFIMVVGSVLTVLFAPRVPREEEKEFTEKTLIHKWIEVPFVFYFAIGGALVPLLMYRFFRVKRGPVTLAVTLSILSSFSITLSKIATELVEGNNFFKPQAIAMLLCWVVLLVLQVVLLQIGLKNFEQSGAFSVGGVLGGALTIMSGMLYYQTYKNFESEESKYGFGFGVALLLYGILVFSQRKNISRQEMKRRLMADTLALEEEEEREALVHEHEAHSHAGAVVHNNDLSNPLLSSRGPDLESQPPFVASSVLIYNREGDGDTAGEGNKQSVTQCSVA